MHGLTKGYLPVTAFRHLEPTAVGVVDLEQSITPRAPDGRAWSTEQRDSLLLIRLHDEPLAVLYLRKPPESFTADELSAEIWQSAGPEIRQHVERFDCMQMPTTADVLVSGLRARPTNCSGRKPTKMKLSTAVIVPTVGREEQLTRCIRSLLAQRDAEFEVIVVDNRPATGAALRAVSALATEDPRVRYVSEWRGGSSVARNRGASETDADIVAFTDDDVFVDPSWLEWLIAPFSESAVTASCGMVLPLELQTEEQKRFELYGGFSKGIEGHSYDMQNRHTGLLLYPFLGDIFGSGNSMAFRRADFVAAGGFDPALGGGSPAQSGEDIYAFSTAILRGGRLIYEPRSVCWHQHRRDREALYRQVFDYGVGLGAILTKALFTGGPHFYEAIARSMPVAFGLVRQKYGSANGDTPDDDASSDELVHVQNAGMLRGPWRYAKGVGRTRRLRLGEAIDHD